MFASCRLTEKRLATESQSHPVRDKADGLKNSFPPAPMHLERGSMVAAGGPRCDCLLDGSRIAATLGGTLGGVARYNLSQIPAPIPNSWLLNAFTPLPASGKSATTSA